MAYNVPFNPYGSMQQFPQGYQQQYQMMQQQPQQIQQEAYLCRPVTSREEAVATPVDYMRATLLPDMGHGKIYLKRFNPQTGASDILEFAQCIEQEQPAPKYATVEDLEALRSEIEKMKRQSGKGKKNDDE